MTTSPWTPTDPDGRAAYLAVALTPGIGAARFAQVRQACSSPLGALAAPLAFWGTVPGVSRAFATALGSMRPEAGAAALAQCERLGGTVLLPHDDAFPARLRDIPDAPVALYALGDLGLLEQPGVAVVGSRDHSPYGETACRLVVEAALQGGALVVSGMARGIDAVAHTAALDLGGATIGVLGNGLGVIYPAANRALYERVARDGLLLTELPPGERPATWSFPRRNRLVSALAHVVVVVEAAEGSGALITAMSALEQSRDVLAVPGPITLPTSVGVNGLIRDGATPYLMPGDLWQRLPGGTARAVGVAPAAQARRALPPDLPPTERAATELLAAEVLDPDQLAARLGLGAGDVLALVTALELRGLVEALPGPRFRARAL